jgi:hypothetical protein
MGFYYTGPNLYLLFLGFSRFVLNFYNGLELFYYKRLENLINNYMNFYFQHEHTQVLQFIQIDNNKNKWNLENCLAWKDDNKSFHPTINHLFTNIPHKHIISIVFVNLLHNQCPLHDLMLILLLMDK